MLCNPFRVDRRGVARFPGVREYATPGSVVQPLRGKDDRGVAAFRGCASTRPPALLCNRFAVRTR